MKKRTINLIITQKFEEWTKTITDENVKKLVEQNTICTGGAIASMLLNEEVNDFDFYFRNKETAKAVAEYYVKKFLENPTNSFKSQNTGEVKFGVVEEGDRIKIMIKSAGVAAEGEQLHNYQYFEQLSPQSVEADQFVNELTTDKTITNKTKPKTYRPVFLSSNAITLTNEVQLIFRFFGEPAELHENYDFVHCTNFWTSWDKQVTLKPEALEALITKELKYVGSKYPICSLFRIRKFIKRGFTISAGQIVKIVWQIKALNLDDFKVLEDQFFGVDVAYFAEILAKLKEKNPDVIDSSYLLKLIDEVF